MKTIQLSDHELSVTDYSNFELNLLLRGGTITATVETSSTNGAKRIRLTDPMIVFDETNSAEARIESLLKSRGFRHKALHNGNGDPARPESRAGGPVDGRFSSAS
jgi:hypothetical protein